MTMRLPFRYIEPAFFSGLLDDPVLYLKVRPLGRGLLVDCGQIHHLAKRVLKSLDAVFVSHAHMDHFMGIDSLTRSMHVAPRTIEIYGPPGIAEKLSHKLQGYDWNLTEETWGSYRVLEIYPTHSEIWQLAGPEGFCLRRVESRSRGDAVIYRNPYLKVEADIGDHKIPVLMFRLTERESFAVEPDKLRALGLVAGDWLKEMNRRFYRGELEGQSLQVLWLRDGRPQPATESNAGQLYRQIRKEQPPCSIGYVTDVGFTQENAAKIERLMQGVSLLICECSYLAENRERARISYHLCTDDLNRLIEKIRPRFVLPMHLSKNYIGKGDRLYRELQTPPGVGVLKLPEYRTPRPGLPREFGWDLES